METGRVQSGNGSTSARGCCLCRQAIVSAAQIKHKKLLFKPPATVAREMLESVAKEKIGVSLESLFPREAYRPARPYYLCRDCDKRLQKMSKAKADLEQETKDIEALLIDAAGDTTIERAPTATITTPAVDATTTVRASRKRLRSETGGDDDLREREQARARRLFTTETEPDYQLQVHYKFTSAT